MSVKGLQDVLQEAQLELSVHQDISVETAHVVQVGSNLSKPEQHTPMVLFNDYPVTIVLAVVDAKGSKEEQLRIWRQIADRLSVSFKFSRASKSVVYSCRHSQDTDMLIEVREALPLQIHVHTTIHIHAPGEQPDASQLRDLGMDVVLGLRDQEPQQDAISLHRLLQYAYLGSPLSVQRILSLRHTVSFTPLFSLTCRTDETPRATVITIFLHTPPLVPLAPSFPEIIITDARLHVEGIRVVGAEKGLGDDASSVVEGTSNASVANAAASACPSFACRRLTGDQGVLAVRGAHGNNSSGDCRRGIRFVFLLSRLVPPQPSPAPVPAAAPAPAPPSTSTSTSTSAAVSLAFSCGWCGGGGRGSFEQEVCCSLSA